MSMRKDTMGKYALQGNDEIRDIFNDSFGKEIIIRYGMKSLDYSDQNGYLALYPSTGQKMIFNKIQFEQFVNKLIQIKERWS